MEESSFSFKMASTISTAAAKAVIRRTSLQQVHNLRPLCVPPDRVNTFLWQQIAGECCHSRIRGKHHCRRRVRRERKNARSQTLTLHSIGYERAMRAESRNAAMRARRFFGAADFGKQLAPSRQSGFVTTMMMQFGECYDLLETVSLRRSLFQNVAAHAGFAGNRL